MFMICLFIFGCPLFREAYFLGLLTNSPLDLETFCFAVAECDRLVWFSLLPDCCPLSANIWTQQHYTKMKVVTPSLICSSNCPGLCTAESSSLHFESKVAGISFPPVTSGTRESPHFHCSFCVLSWLTGVRTLSVTISWFWCRWTGRRESEGEVTRTDSTHRFAPSFQIYRIWRRVNGSILKTSPLVSFLSPLQKSRLWRGKSAAHNVGGV